MNDTEVADYTGRLDTAEHLLRVSITADIKEYAKTVAGVFKLDEKVVVNDLMRRFGMKIAVIDWNRV